MDILNLQHFCGIAKKKDQQKQVRVFGDSEVFVFDILEKKDMLFFKDRKNGTICRALGFLHLYKKMSWDQVENVLIDCYMPSHEAKIEIEKEKSLISLYSGIERFRNDYMSAQSRIGHSPVFGDWMRMPRNDFVSIFGYVFDTPIQKCSEYNLCIMRDESGIPNLVHVYSSNNRFLGVANIGITSSSTTIQYESVIDSLGWNEARQILCQELDVASFVTRMLPDASTMPVGLIVNAGGVPNYGSVQFPVTFWVSRYDEAPHKIINFYNGKNSLLTYRLPNKAGESFTPTLSLSNLTLHKSSVDFCRDIAAFSSRNKINGIIDFVKTFLSSASINRDSKSAIVMEYTKRMGIDYDEAISLIRKYGIGSETTTIKNKTYFIKDSKYHCVALGSKMDKTTVVSNFVVMPEKIYTIEGKKHVVEGTLICEGKSSTFLIPRDKLIFGSQLMEELTKESDSKGMCIPLIYNSRDVSVIKSIIVGAIAGCSSTDTVQLGFKENSSYTTSLWKSTPQDMVFFDNPLPSAGQKDLSTATGYHRSSKTYEKEAMAYLHSICKDDKIKTMIFFVLKILNSKLNGGAGTLFLEECAFNCCSELLGCKISKEIEETNQLQMSIGNCTSLFARNNKIVSIILNSNTTAKAKGSIVFLDDITMPKNKGPVLLPMITKLALSCSPPKAMQLICDSDYFDEVARAEKISYAFHSGEAKSFFENLKELGLDKKFIHTNDNTITIEIARCIKELGLYGIEINKKSVIQNLKDMGVRFQYPVRKFHDRARCLVINGQTENLF